MSKEKQSALEKAIESLTVPDTRDRIVSSVWYDLPQKKHGSKVQKHYALELIPDESQIAILEQNFDGYAYVHDYYTQELQKMSAHMGRLWEKYGRITPEVLHKDARGICKNLLKKGYERDYERTSIYYAIKFAYKEWRLSTPHMYQAEIIANKRPREFYVKNNADYSRVVIHKNQIRLSRNLGHFQFKTSYDPESILGIIEYIRVYKDIYSNRYFAVLFMINPDLIPSEKKYRGKDLPETLSGVLHNCDQKANRFADTHMAKRLDPFAEHVLFMTVIPGEYGITIQHENGSIDYINYPKNALTSLHKYQELHSKYKCDERHGKRIADEQRLQLKELKRSIRKSISNAAHHIASEYMYASHHIILYTFPVDRINAIENFKIEFMYPYLYNTYANEIECAFTNRRGRFTGTLTIVPTDAISLDIRCYHCDWERKSNKTIRLYGVCPHCHHPYDLVEQIFHQMNHFILEEKDRF